MGPKVMIVLFPYSKSWAKFWRKSGKIKKLNKDYIGKKDNNVTF